MEYIKLTYEQAVEVNDILYFELVTEDGINFKFPFDSGTNCYINPDEYEYAYMVDAEMISVAEYNTTIAAYLGTAVDFETAVANGWIAGF